MTTEPQKQDLYHLVKNGMYFRPDGAGYTASIKEAGIFSEDHALRYCRGCDEVEMHIVTDKLEAPADADQTATMQAMDILQQRIAFLERQLENATRSPISLPDYEPFMSLDVTNNTPKYCLGFKSNADRAAFLKQALTAQDECAWKPIDTLPTGQRAILANYILPSEASLAIGSKPFWDIEIGREYSAGRFTSILDSRASHWMPLPAPPTNKITKEI